MQHYTPKQYIELFHLLFLDQLGRKLDKRFYCLKGGCNMRFFFRSCRYSEDIDLDAGHIPKHTLEDAVDGILGSAPFARVLDISGIAIERVSASKQTETTQRWKLGLAVPGAGTPLPTKIEFSRRGMEEGTVFETIDPVVIGNYNLSPIMANHYDGETALKQKIEALLTRKTTQARDLFDIHHLLARGVSTDILAATGTDRLAAARSKALSVSFDMFKGQVLSFLDPDDRDRYDSPATWDDVVLNIVEVLEEKEA